MNGTIRADNINAKQQQQKKKRLVSCKRFLIH